MNYWQFTYLRGSARYTGNVEASSAEIALALAQEWCAKNSVLMGGSRMLPFCLARENEWKWMNDPRSPLSEEVPADHTPTLHSGPIAASTPLPDPVSATTMTQTLKDVLTRK